MTCELKYSDADYKKIATRVKSKFSLQEITDKWNESGQGKPCKPVTVKRWLNPGPETKNPRFEPFIIRLDAGLLSTATSKKAPKVIKPVKVKAPKVISVRQKIKALETGRFNTLNQRATAASIVSFYKVTSELSDRQLEIVHTLYNKIIK